MQAIQRLGYENSAIRTFAALRWSSL